MNESFLIVGLLPAIHIAHVKFSLWKMTQSQKNLLPNLT